MMGDERRAMDARSAVVAATLMCIAGAATFLVQPGYVQALVDQGRLSGDQAGYVAASEMAGIASTTFLTSLVSHRWRWRSLLGVAAAMELAGNLACVPSGDFGWLLVLRFLAGLGGGVLVSISFTAIGETRDPDRSFGFLMMWVLLYGAVGLFGMPRLLEQAGMPGFYLTIALIVLAGLMAVRWMPERAGSGVPPMIDAAQAQAGMRMLLAVAFLVFFLAAGILWAYLSLIGGAASLSEQSVASAVALSQGTGLLGALVPGLIGARFGRVRPLVLSVMTTALCAAALRPSLITGALGFALLVCLFNFTWNVAQPVFLGAAAAQDPSGRLVSHMVTMQMVGLAIGPFAGALVVTGGYGLIASSAALMFGCSALLALPTLLRGRGAGRSPVLSA